MSVDCLEFVFSKETKAQPPGIFAVYGGDGFLTELARKRIREWVIGPEVDDFTYSVYEGDEAKLSDVFDDLYTPPFVGDRRLVVVQSADKFVTAHRVALERFAENLSDCGTLLLEPKSWTKTTKLAKIVEKQGLAVEAKAPEKPAQAESWCVQWARRQYAKKLSPPVAAMIVELVGTNLGQLDQELCKLANYLGDEKEIDLKVVQTLVAGTHAEETYMLLQHALEGQLPHALDQLDRMLVAGTAPQMIVGTLVTQLRKLTRAARLIVGGMPMKAALEDSGIRHPFAIRKGEQQLRLLGRERMAGMYRRLLQLDYDIKGGSTESIQALLERFLIELASPRQPQRTR